jgi:signal transduction histidine kinase
MGLVSMQQRAALLGGDVTIDSTPEVGTTVKATVATQLRENYEEGS